jgi:predicted double-glycine peptidase
MKIVRRVFSLSLLILGGVAGWEARGIFQPAAAPSAAAFSPFESAGPALLEGVPDVRQSTSYSCGAAALQAVLGYYGIEAREDVLMKELRTTEAQGTHPADILRVARARGLRAELREGLTLDDLRAALAKGTPVMVAMQAWADVQAPGFSWAKTWEDGHYVIVLGMNAAEIVVEDPSLLGCRGIIPLQEFIDRWHDYEGQAPLDASDRTYVRMGIFIDGRLAAKPERFCPVK